MSSSPNTSNSSHSGIASSPSSSSSESAAKGGENKVLKQERVRELRSAPAPLPPNLFPGESDDGSDSSLDHIGNFKQLYCRVGFHLAIYRSGKVRGVDKSNSRFVVLEFSSADFGEVRIKGLLAGLYLAMDCNGRLYGEPNASDEATVFVESYINGYNTYLSKKYAHCGWYVGIRKNGRQLNGKKTSYARKNVHFLPRAVERRDVIELVATRGPSGANGDGAPSAIRTVLPATCDDDDEEEEECRV